MKKDDIYINEEFVRQYIDSAVMPWERRGEPVPDKLDILRAYKDLDAQLDHIDSLIERGISDDYDKHYDLLRRIDEVWAKLQVAEREELDPFGPADGQDNQDYDNLDYENDNMMYEQLRRGEG